MSCRVPVFCLYICKRIFRFLRESLELEENATFIFRICLEIHIGVL